MNLGLVQTRPAGGGVTDHGLLLGLGDDDHSIYALLAGRAGGQTLKGGAAASENLTLQSTVDAVRGYVRAQDDLQLLSNILRGSDAVNRLKLAAASPNILLTGQTRIDGDVGINTFPNPTYGIDINKTATTIARGLRAMVYCDSAAGFTTATGVFGFAYHRGAAASGGAQGLSFTGGILAAATGANMTVRGIQAGVLTQAGAYTVSYLCGLEVTAALSGPAPLQAAYGLNVPDYGQAATPAVYGVCIADQTQGVLRRCLEVGPTGSPYFRVLGGWVGVANQTPVYLVEGVGPTLRQVRWMDPGAGGGNFVGGERVMVLV